MDAAQLAPQQEEEKLHAHPAELMDEEQVEECLASGLRGIVTARASLKMAGSY